MKNPKHKDVDLLEILKEPMPTVWTDKEQGLFAKAVREFGKDFKRI